MVRSSWEQWLFPRRFGQISNFSLKPEMTLYTAYVWLYLPKRADLMPYSCLNKIEQISSHNTFSIHYQCRVLTSGNIHHPTLHRIHVRVENVIVALIYQMSDRQHLLLFGRTWKVSNRQQIMPNNRSRELCSTFALLIRLFFIQDLWNRWAPVYLDQLPCRRRRMCPGVRQMRFSPPVIIVAH